ncbi:uncharacterized protein METZ01_LOCUS54273 [marine metagenome]|uniref:Uncharacterized protein n=1 Tax=marine metagenome TaxID=408172 RepID=A0A381SD47_9ZZZZ
MDRVASAPKVNSSACQLDSADTTNQVLLPVKEGAERTRPEIQLIQPSYLDSTRVLD